MNTIGIDDNLNRERICKLLEIGLFASVMTGIGDFLLGYGEEMEADGFAQQLMANALSLSDAQLIAGGLLGAVGLFLEGMACFAIYRLMADSSLKYAHIYRAGIIGYIWLAPIGCHMNVGLMNIAYKYLLVHDASAAAAHTARSISLFGRPNSFTASSRPMRPLDTMRAAITASFLAARRRSSSRASAAAAWA